MYRNKIVLSADFVCDLMRSLSFAAGALPDKWNETHHLKELSDELFLAYSNAVFEEE